MDSGDATATLKRKLVEETARRFASERLAHGHAATQERGRPAKNICAAFGELGLGLAPLPQRLGGLELGAAAACQIAQLLAAGDPALAFALPQPGAFAELMLLWGNTAQQVEWLDSFGKAPERTWGAVAVCNQDARRLVATAERSGFVLDGVVHNVWHTKVADRLLVVTEPGSRGRQAFVMPLPCHGITIVPHSHSIGLQAATCGDITFKSVRLEAQQHLTGRPIGESQAQTEAALDLFYARQGLRMASYAVVAALSAARYTLNFAEERRAQGKLIEHYNVLGFLLADMHLACEASAEQLLHTAAAADALGASGEAVDKMVHARQQADGVALSVVESAHNILGDLGAAPGHPTERWLADVRLLAAWGKPKPKRVPRRPRAKPN